MYQLQIRARNSLLSIVLDREITDTQASIIREVLDTPSLTYGEAFEFLSAERQLAAQLDRLDGIAQYQAESR